MLSGAAGFIGRATRRRLEADGCRVLPLSRAVPWSATGLAGFLAAAGADAVIHLAAPPPADPPAAHEAAMEMSLALLRACAAAAPRARFIALGSAAEYGAALGAARAMREDDACDPRTPYARAKHAATLALDQAWREGRDAGVLRLFGAVGPGMPGHLLLGTVARQIAADRQGARPVLVGPLDGARDYVDVAFVAEVLAGLALRRQPMPPLLNLAGGVPVALHDIVREMVRLDGARREVIEAASPHAAPALRVWGDTRLLAEQGFRPAPLSARRIAARALGMAPGMEGAE